MTNDDNDEYEKIAREVHSFDEESVETNVSKSIENQLGKSDNLSVNEESYVGKDTTQKFQKNRKVITRIAIVIIFVFVVAFVALGSYTYFYPNIHKGIKCSGIDLSGMTYEQANDELLSKASDMIEDQSIQIMIANKSYTINISEVTIGIDTNETANNAYSFTRNGNFFQRIKNTTVSLFKGTTIPVAFKIDDQKINDVFNTISNDAITLPKEPKYEIEGGNLILTMGEKGINFYKDEALSELYEKIYLMDYKPLNIEVVVQDAPEVDFEKIKAEIDCEPKNAEVDKQDGITIIPEINGVLFDIDTAKRIVGDGTEKIYTIPITITPAEMTAEKLRPLLFLDTLATVTTKLNPGLVDRTANVRLAAEFVNGTVLNGEEEFSYNTVVGPRKAERGFRNAKVFQDGGVVDGMGGGICQTSSTIYMAVLRADLEVTERRNHTFAVSYTPLGQDATVVYGLQDFKFVNNTKYPIKILASQKGNSITVTLMGTKDTDKTVTLANVVTSKIPMQTVTKVDETLLKGQKKVEGGYTGYKVTLYKTVTENGQTTKTVENKSNYKKKDKVIFVAVEDDPALQDNPVLNPTEPTDSTTPIDSTDSTTPVDPTEPIDQNKPVDSTESAETDTPMVPDVPVSPPTEPSESMDSNDPES